MVQGGVAADLNLLGGLCLNTGDAACALQATQQAAALLATLVREDPGHAAWRQPRRFLALNLGRALLTSAQPEAALAALAVAVDGLGPRVAQGQASPMLLRRWAPTRLARATALWTLGRRPEAQAAADVQVLAQAQPQERDHGRVLGETAATLPGWADAGRAGPWRQQALTACDSAQRLQPLTAQHARRAAALRGV